jgi:hypothetical protein
MTNLLLGKCPFPNKFVISTGEVMGFGPPKVMKIGLGPATALLGSVTLPFVISTEAQRSGEICGSTDLSWKCFSTELSWADGLPKVMKNALSPATTLHGSASLPFVISTEAYPDFLLRGANNDHGCGSP